MAVISIKQLLETGVHFGHRTRRWHPKMAPYIFTERNGIHILDLQQTVHLLEGAYATARDIVAGGGYVLFVGTKRQAVETIAVEAARASQPYVNQRWMGGTLTNWQTIRTRIRHLEQLEKRRDAGEFEGLKKRERLTMEREINKLNLRLGGIRKMAKLPDMLFVIDVNYEETAIREANILGIPVIALVDTNVNPDPIEHPIPANDDAIRAIKLLTAKMADACMEGMAMRKDAGDGGDAVETFTYDPQFEEMQEATDEDLLGAATLAKIRADEQAAAEAAAAADEAAKAAAAAEVEAEEAPAADTAAEATSEAAE